MTLVSFMKKTQNVINSATSYLFSLVFSMLAIIESLIEGLAMYKGMATSRL